MLLRFFQHRHVELDRLAIRCIQQSIAQRQRVDMLEGVRNRPEISQRFAHLLPVNVDQAIVKPILDNRLYPETTLGLEYLSLVVGEQEIGAAAVDIEGLTQMLE